MIYGKLHAEERSMDKKYAKYVKALLMAVAAFAFMTLFWRFLGSFVPAQTGYLAWSWTLVRKLTTLGFTAMAFFGGLR
jgi:hypothetical protein